ncbi:hypothetical protein [Halanaerobacter jeridensis]|uniref:Ribosomal protein L17 n=1 Tax=Halanaerobacter jeridensis TaxID=706427 RepID=A0A939BMU2_9FIRM|nr:hypothetical protein [Halanaerobacter jeridensis]MBM7557510.1 ribosomal protein L17 [Halanaerobacter jeridensis]
MEQLVSINQLADSFTLHPKKVKLYINQLKDNTDLIPKQQDNKVLLSEQAEEYFNEVKDYENNHPNLLNYALCKEINSLPNQLDKSFILQLTKRTKLKQQKEHRQFEELPKLIKLEKKSLAKKIISWLENKVVISDLNKVIVDRFSSDESDSEKNPDLRITLYEGNHPQDINLIIKEQLNYLKKIYYHELSAKLDTETELNSLDSLQEALSDLNDEQLVKRIFKTLVGYKNYYKITTNPEMIIIDFSHIKLPDKFEVHRREDCLLLEFNNDCQITIHPNHKPERLITKLKKEPEAMELFAW